MEGIKIDGETAKSLYNEIKEMIVSEKNDLQQSELNVFDKLFVKYSTFNIDLIGKMIEQLITRIEMEDYLYDNSIYKFKKRVHGAIDSWDEEEQIRLKIIAKKDALIECRDCNEYSYKNESRIYKLIQNGEAIVLSEQNFYSRENKNVTFYTIYKGQLKCLINFNNFSYVKDFMDLVLKYRFKNNLDEMSEKNLLYLMYEFILKQKKRVEDNYIKRILEKQKQLKQQFMEEQERLKKQVIEEQLRRKEEMERVELKNLLQNGVPSRYNNTLIDRLNEEVNANNTISQFEIFFEGEKYSASINYDEPIISLENIFISKINIESSIKDYYDDSDSDPHLQGFCDINLVDDGLIGIVDISNLKQDLDNITNVSSQYELLYKVDRINEKYLRVLFLPNNGTYSYKSISVYAWILGLVCEKTTSYKKEWNCSLETEKMLTYLKEIELLSNLNENQLKLYRKSII